MKHVLIALAAFWKNIKDGFDNATSIGELVLLAQDLQNEHKAIGDSIRKHLKKFNRKVSVEDLDRIKLYIRRIIIQNVFDEEKCYRDFRRKWSLNLGIRLSTYINENISPVSVTGLGTDPTEKVEQESTSISFSVGTSHSLNPFWSHAHTYYPTWRSYSLPTGLAPDSYFLSALQGTQLKSRVINRLSFSTIDNTFNPTQGRKQNFQLDLVGGYLGGDDHYNRYTISGANYFWWFDFYILDFPLECKLPCR